MKYEYSLEDKLSGNDLYGLPCRVPNPTPEQEKCSHSKYVKRDFGFTDDDDVHHPDIRFVEEDIMEDIPGTHLIRCPKCNYTRRY